MILQIIFMLMERFVHGVVILISFYCYKVFVMYLSVDYLSSTVCCIYYSRNCSLCRRSEAIQGL